MSGREKVGSTTEAELVSGNRTRSNGEEIRHDDATGTEVTEHIVNNARLVASAGAPVEPSMSSELAGDFDDSDLDASHAEAAKTALSPTTLRRRLILADVAALIAGIALGFIAQHLFGTTSRSLTLDQLGLVSASLPVFVLAAGSNRLYQARANTRRLEEAMNIFKTVAAGMSALLLIALVVQHRDLSRLWVGSTAIGITFAVLLERRVARSMFTRLRQQGRTQRRIIMVGTDEHAVSLVEAYDNTPALGYKVVGFVGEDDVAVDSRADLLGAPNDLDELLKRHDAVGVVVSLSSVPADTVNGLTRRVTDLGYHVALSSSLRDIDAARLRTQTEDGRTMIYVERTLRGGWRGVAKRIFDLALAMLILVLTLPLQLCAAIAVVTTSRGPIFFRQIRVGQHGELFEILKFRTMYEDAEGRLAGLMDQNEADGPLFKMRIDPRVTGVGRIMRKLSIDELPQLFCVLIGSMSMVGPRPALPHEVEQWDNQTRDRLRVPPGLTGMWQVSGRSNNSFETYKRMDLYYVDNWSLWHDLTICARTVGVVLSGSGAS
jgi:exopolysaccharide biosynthesis polyprenyl glycosylphosphotransferase